MKKCMHNIQIFLCMLCFYFFDSIQSTGQYVNKVVINNLLDSRANNVRYTMRKKGAAGLTQISCVCVCVCCLRINKYYRITNVVSFDRTMAQLGQKFRFVHFFFFRSFHYLRAVASSCCFDWMTKYLFVSFGKISLVCYQITSSID